MSTPATPAPMTAAEIASAGPAAVIPSPTITLVILQDVVALSTSFADFQTRVAALT